MLLGCIYTDEETGASQILDPESYNADQLLRYAEVAQAAIVVAEAAVVASRCDLM